MGPTRVTAAVPTPSHPLHFLVDLPASTRIFIVQMLPIQNERHTRAWRQATLPISPPTPGRAVIWKLHLDSSEPSREPGDSLLSPDEFSRAKRFHFPKDRNQFVRCRSALRRLIGEYLAISPAEVRFKYSASGKPQIEPDQNACDLQFNLAHSGDLALLAFGTGHQLGVDIEKIRGDVDTYSLAERFFSLREREGLRALPEPLRVTGFFACWARKEAFLKATGDGLSFPLSKFSVSVHPDRDAAIEEVNGNEEDGKRWFLADLPAEPDYRAALVGSLPRLSFDTLDFPEKQFPS